LQPPDSIAAHYSELTDGELQRLAAELGTLTPEAQSALESELQTRKLSLGDFGAGTSLPQKPVEIPRLIVALRSSGYWVGHTFLGSLGIAIGVAMFFYSIKIPLSVIAPSLTTHNGLLILPLFPLQTFAGALYGFLIVRKKALFWRSRSADLAWFLPVAFLVFLFYSYDSASVLSETRWQHFFWSSFPRVRSYQLGSTMLALASVAYSLGHYVSRKLQNRAAIINAEPSCL
jgi:hypothetical protein